MIEKLEVDDPIDFLGFPCYRLTGHEYGADGKCKICYSPSPELIRRTNELVRLYMKINELIEVVNRLAKNDNQ